MVGHSGAREPVGRAPLSHCCWVGLLCFGLLQVATPNSHMSSSEAIPLLGVFDISSSKVRVYSTCSFSAFYWRENLIGSMSSRSRGRGCDLAFAVEAVSPACFFPGKKKYSGDSLVHALDPGGSDSFVCLRTPPEFHLYQFILG